MCASSQRVKAKSPRVKNDTRPPTLPDLSALHQCRTRLRSLLQRFGHPKFTFEQTSEVCMLSRRESAEFAGAALTVWNLTDAGRLPVVNNITRKDVERDLKDAVDAVRKVTRSNAPFVLEKKRLLHYYLSNEALRLARIRSLAESPTAFMEAIETQRNGALKVRAQPPNPWLNFWPSPSVSRISEAKTGRVPSEPRSGSSLELSDDKACNTRLWWLKCHYIEVNNFLLEIELEASPFAPSAREQSLTAQAIVARSRQRLETYFDGSPEAIRAKAQFQRKADVLLNHFTAGIEDPLAEAANRDEVAAERIFDSLKKKRPVVLQAIQDMADAVSRGILPASARPRRRSRPKWTDEMQAKFSRLAAREALGQIKPDEMVELKELDAKRERTNGPATLRERRAIRSAQAMTARHIKKLEKYAAAYEKENSALKSETAQPRPNTASSGQS